MLPVFSIGVLMGGRTLVAPTTSYANAGGTGARYPSVVTGSTNISWNFSTGLAQILDGDFTANTTHSIDANVTVSAGGRLIFDFLAKKYIDEVKITADRVVANGAWKFQVSETDNGSTFDLDLASFTWNAQVKTVTLTGLNAAGYRYYRMVCPGGQALTNAYWKEIEFKIADGAV